MGFNNYVALTTKEDRTIYVDYDLGTDDFDHGDASGGGAYKTLIWALLTVPKNLKHDIIINVAQNTGTAQEYANLQVKGFFGEGSLSIIGKTTGLPSHGDYLLAKTIAGNTLFEVINCATEINVQGIEFSVAAAVIQGGYGIRCYGSPRVLFDDCLIYYHSVGAAAEYSSARFNDCDFKDNIDGLRSNTCALVEVEDCISSTTNASNGMVADSGVIFKDGTSPTGSVANTVEQNGGIISPIVDLNYRLYDAVIDIGGGGDYTSIVAAFAAEGANKSYFIRRGTYSETADVVFPAGATIYFDYITIDFDSGAYKVHTASATYCQASGYLTITGPGATNSTLWYLGGSYNDFKALYTYVIPKNYDDTLVLWPVYIKDASYNNFGTTMIKDVDLTTGNSVAGVMFNVYTSIWSRGIFILDNISFNSPSDLHGSYVDGSSLYNNFNYNFDTLVNPGAGTSYCLNIVAASNYNIVSGVLKDSTGATFTDNGTGTNKVQIIEI